MTSPLENLIGRDGPLAAEPPNAAEFEGLRKTARSSLIDARRTDNALSSRFRLAYAAAHAYCLAALRHQGYRARHRYVVFQVLPHTLGLGPEVWRILDKAHEARNLAEYEGHVDVSETFLRDVIGACEKVAARVEALPDIPEEPS
jgi:hypothetical protein